MTNNIKFTVGDKVRYQPSHYPPDRYENGRVKEIPPHTDDAVRVVYHCDGQWSGRWMDFTSALTNIDDLKAGWMDD